jgi:oligopeptide/dipeptide ABC transporter ATP-binding protein
MMRDSAQPLVKARDLRLSFDLPRSHPFAPRKRVHAVDGVNLDILAGETFAVVGESGSGKSTLGRLLIGAARPSAGHVWFGDVNISCATRSQWLALRRQLQLIFQHAGASFNPRRTIGSHLYEVFVLHPDLARSEPDAVVSRALDRVGLHAGTIDRYPHQLSGGQQQRAAIARALLFNPRFVVCDEIVSALDLSVQAQVLNLLRELQQESGVSLLFISHDLSVVRYLSHRVAVMYAGRIVEVGVAESIFLRPMHPYTRALLGAIPRPDPTAPRPSVSIRPSPANAAGPLGGCRLQARCPFATDICRTNEPELAERLDHDVACHHPQGEPWPC